MKVLIISHNPISNQSNMGKTFLSLFSKFDSSELCQLYIYPTIPNEKRCHSYFRITDRQVLSSLFRGKVPGGRIDPEQIREDHSAFENGEDEQIYRSRKNKSALRRLLRDAMWGMSRWYSRELKVWLEEEKPDCMFVAPGVAKFIHNFALRISRDYRIPIVTYVCDEYYFVKKPPMVLDRFRLILLKRKIDRLMARTNHLVVISRELMEHYREKFSVPTSVLMTGSAFEPVESTRETEEPREISYFGNIRCNRFVSLGQIGEVLDEINQKTDRDYRLKIYSAEKDPEILSSLQKYASVEICGFVSGNAFTEALLDAQLLLHTEAFDDASMEFVRHSISTKIADSLASGVPLVAYGPAGISSMEHLARNDCAMIALEPGALRDVLLRAFQEESYRQRVVKNALDTARRDHDSDKNGVEFRRILMEAAGKTVC